MRLRARTDRNHNEIVRVLEQCGCSVQSLAQLGGGAPDLLLGLASHNHLVEIKDGTKSPSERVLTPDQQRWHAGWNAKVHIIESVQQALDLVRFLRWEMRK